MCLSFLGGDCVDCLASSGAMHFLPLWFPGNVHLFQTKFILELVWVTIITRAWKSKTSLKLGPLKRRVSPAMHSLHLSYFSESLWQLINWSGGEYLFFALIVDIVNMEGLHVLTTSSKGVLFGSVISLIGPLGVLAESAPYIVSDWRWYLQHFLHMEILKSTFDR